MRKISGKIVLRMSTLITQSQVSDAWQMLSHLKEELSHLK